jgi:hypothetical protein
METINIKVNKVTEEDFVIELPFYGKIGDSLIAIENDTFETCIQTVRTISHHDL